MFPTAGVHPYLVEGCGSLEDAMASIANLAANEEGAREASHLPVLNYSYMLVAVLKKHSRFFFLLSHIASTAFITADIALELLVQQ